MNESLIFALKRAEEEFKNNSLEPRLYIITKCLYEHCTEQEKKYFIKNREIVRVVDFKDNREVSYLITENGGLELL